MNLPEIAHHDDTPAAPGRLELIQRFLNLHDHTSGGEGDLPPPPDMVRAFLVERGLLPPGARYSDREHAAVLALYEALHERLRAEDAGRSTGRALRRIEEVARRASFHLRFGEAPALEPAAGGVDGALGRLLAVLFVADLDGSWSQMKECASDTCTAVFYDRSKNHSGKWCSMQSCGNKHKVRAWRARHRTDAVDA